MKRVCSVCALLAILAGMYLCAEKVGKTEGWKQAYLAYLDSMGDYAEFCTYSLIYVDDDEIPEMVIDTHSGAGGSFILTFGGHELDEEQCSGNVTYIEGENLLCDSCGSYGHYYDNVYTIQDGEWEIVAGGIYGDGPDGPQLDENENLIYVYNWDGEDVSEEEYRARLNEVYPVEQGGYPQDFYILSEMLSLLRTGDVT